jgi:hypothetical protein
MPDTPPAFGFASRLRATVALILGVMLVRLVFLAFFSPYGLSEDEAHYWEWSRRLDWSYYSKGPGIAWTIALSRSIFGDTELGVRALMPLCGALIAGAGAWGAYLLRRDPRHAFCAAAAVVLWPPQHVMSLLATIDGPYVACWALATLLAARAMETRRARWWLALGAAIGAGFLFKYTMLLFLPGLALAAWARRVPVRAWAGPGALLLFPLLLACVPVVVWNANHDWVTVRHLMGHLGLAGGDIPRESLESHSFAERLSWPPQFVGIQLLISFPLGVLAWAGWRLGRADRASVDHIGPALALPMVAFYGLVSLFTPVEGNWTIACYASLAPLAGLGAVRGHEVWTRRRQAWLARAAPRPKFRTFEPAPGSGARAAWRWALGLGLFTGLLSLSVDKAARLPVLGPVIPAYRVMSGPAWAEAVETRLEGLRRAAAPAQPPPLVISSHYGRASLVTFYLPGHPLVRCASPLLPPAPEVGRGPGRKTQYDFWPEADLADPALRGADAVLIGAAKVQWEGAFERVEEAGTLPGKRGRELFIGYGFKGFASD